MSYPGAKICMSCLRTGACARTCPDLYVYSMNEPPIIPGPRPYRMDDTVRIDPNRFTEGHEMAVQGRSAGSGVPGWSLVSVFVGAVLVALGLVLNDPTSRLVYGYLIGGW